MSAGTIGRLIDLLKAVRSAPLTREEVAVGLGWSINAVYADIKELEAQGLLVRVDIPSPAPTGPRTRVAFKLSPLWGGQA